MTKKQAEQMFREMLNDSQNFDRKDKPALREAWGMLTDSLCKNGEITPKQYEGWTCPNICK